MEINTCEQYVLRELENEQNKNKNLLKLLQEQNAKVQELTAKLDAKDWFEPNADNSLYYQLFVITGSSFEKCMSEREHPLEDAKLALTDNVMFKELKSLKTQEWYLGKNEVRQAEFLYLITDDKGKKYVLTRSYGNTLDIEKIDDEDKFLCKEAAEKALDEQFRKVIENYIANAEKGENE